MCIRDSNDDESNKIVNSLVDESKKVGLNDVLPIIFGAKEDNKEIEKFPSQKYKTSTWCHNKATKLGLKLSAVKESKVGFEMAPSLPIVSEIDNTKKHDSIWFPNKSKGNQVWLIDAWLKVRSNAPSPPIITAIDSTSKHTSEFPSKIESINDCSNQTISLDAACTLLLNESNEVVNSLLEEIMAKVIKDSIDK